MTQQTMADLVSARIEAAGVSRREIERRAGLPNGTVSLLTSGKNRNPKVETLTALATVFGCKPWDLLPGHDSDGGDGESQGGSADFVYLLPDQVEVEAESNPRTVFADDKLKELAESIYERGVRVPVIVKPGSGPGRFGLVAGERRLRAVRILQEQGRWTDGDRIPAVIAEDVDDQEHLELALIENLQREDLSGWDEACAYRTLRDKHGLSNREIARRIGKSARHVDYCMAFLDLHPAARAAIEDGTIAFAAVRPLMQIERPYQQSVVDQVRAGTLAATLSAIQQKAGQIRSRPKPPEPGAQIDIEDKDDSAPVRPLGWLGKPLPGCIRVHTYRAIDDRCVAAIDMFEDKPGDVHGGFKTGWMVHFSVGAGGHHSTPATADFQTLHPSRNQAIADAARSIAGVALTTYRRTNSLVTDMQRREARKLMEWANDVLFEVGAETIAAPDHDPLPAADLDPTDAEQADQLGDEDEPVPIRTPHVIVAAFWPDGCKPGDMPRRVELYDPTTRKRATYRRDDET